jgi:hypothetical protein
LPDDRADLGKSPRECFIDQHHPLALSEFVARRKSAPSIDIGASGGGIVGGGGGQIRPRFAHTSAPHVATMTTVVARSMSVRLRPLSIGKAPGAEHYARRRRSAGLAD